MGTKKIEGITGQNRTDEIQELKCFSVKKAVLRQIAAKRVRIRRPFIFIVKRLGLESALILAILAGSFFVSAILAVFESRNSVGVGMWSDFPYHYLAFLTVSAFVAIFMADRVELLCGKCRRTAVFASCIPAVIIILGAAFFSLGAGKILSGWLSL